ncbi:MAG: N-acetyl-gamma-glutamyl-phosphate reductase [Desulfobacteraceae bacterium]|nr:N-acetyl-gamma-glutamyl-phosphate reductase [Desulfobacteraceae bacterium]
MIRVGIAGATGYTGAELVKLVAGHPGAELTAVTSQSYRGRAIQDIFPSMRNVVDLTCEALDVDTLSQKIDCVFLALPHKVSMNYASGFVEKNVKVIDLSADFRFQDAAAYESAYQEHVSKDLLERAVYGLSELYRDEIAATDILGNPGCYPTSFLLPMLPLVRQKLVQTDGIISDSKSGVSGAGRAASLGTHFCEVNESFKPYKVGSHRHVPEMEEVLSLGAGEPVTITFVPHLLPLTRGMLTTIYATVTENTTEETIRKTLLSQYGPDTFVRVLPRGEFPDIRNVRGTNFCDIGFHLDKDSGRIIIVSAIDNLLKGAAGQAVQNMNIMFGMAERMGLELLQGAL